MFPQLAVASGETEMPFKSHIFLSICQRGFLKVVKWLLRLESL